MRDSVRAEPCSSCPYRRDVPSGLWAEHEYSKLRLYDERTVDQPMAPFACHATPEHLCSGWAACHSNRGSDIPGDPGAHPYDLMALRMLRIPQPVPMPRTPLFASGNEAADWGQRDIENPSEEAMERVAKLLAKYPRLEG